MRNPALRALPLSLLVVLAVPRLARAEDPKPEPPKTSTVSTEGASTPPVTAATDAPATSAVTVSTEGPPPPGSIVAEAPPAPAEPAPAAAPPPVVIVPIVVGPTAVRPRPRAPVPPITTVKPPAKESVYKKKGLLGPVKLGAFGGAGVPDGARFGLAARYHGLLGVGAAAGVLPTTSVPGVDATVQRQAMEGFARVYPFRGAFFVGAAVGQASVDAAATVQTKGTVAAARASASVVYATPQLGFTFALPLGLTAGFDVGVQLPLATNGPTFEATRNGATEAVEGKGAVADGMKYVTKYAIPTVHILELGFML